METIEPAALAYQSNAVTTQSGRLVDIIAPDPNTIIIEDIAHALSMLCRFGGHVNAFYSVAEHSVLTYIIANEKYGERSDLNIPRMCLAALIHDATEAYMGDVIQPLKRELPRYVELENQLAEVIAKALLDFDPKEYHEMVKWADVTMLITEADFLDVSRDGPGWAAFNTLKPADVTIFGLPPKQAESYFLTQYYMLTEEL